MRAPAEKVAIIGSGNWGSAIAKIVGLNVLRYSDFDKEVRMWVFEEMVGDRKLSEIINKDHENVKYLPGIKLPENIVAVPDLVQSVQDASLLIFVVPHQFVKKTCQDIVGKTRPNAKAISLIKGLDASKSGMNLISDIIRDTLNVDVAVLSGANIASEVAEEKFCETTVGYRNKENALLWHKLFNTPFFRVNIIDDVAGVEICGALKNVVAVAAGFVDGLGLGSNTKAAIIRIGMMEMLKFARQFSADTAAKRSGGSGGVKSEILFESCGVADLITTCFGGRNRKCAEAFVKTGKSIDQLEKELLGGQKLQGTLTSKEVFEYLSVRGLTQEYPLFMTVYRITFEGLPAQRIIEDI